MELNKELLLTGLEKLNIPYDDIIYSKLVKYIAEIELWNEPYGLVGASGDDLIIKHILDSLTPLVHIKTHLKTTLADAGTGAGLPGIPLALYLPDTPVDLIDRMGRRISFLHNQKALLSLDNAEIVESEVEKVKKKYSVVTFRAFRPLEKPMLKALFNLTEKDGYLAAYKGKRSKINEELEPIMNMIKNVEIIETPVPFLDEERHIVFIQSI